MICSDPLALGFALFALSGIALITGFKWGFARGFEKPRTNREV